MVSAGVCPQQSTNSPACAASSHQRVWSEDSSLHPVATTYVSDNWKIPRERSRKMGHRHRAIAASIAAVAAVLAVAGWCAGTAGAATTCTWGGTPADPTGTFEFTGPGFTNTPSSGPV